MDNVTQSAAPDPVPAPAGAATRTTPHGRLRVLPIGLTLLFVIGIVGVRGHVLAKLIEGSYQPASWAFDTLAFGLLLGGLHLLDLLLTTAIRRAVRPQTRRGRVLAAAIRIAVLLVVVLPFLFTTVQLHPQRIACTGDPGRLSLQFEEVVLDSGGIRLAGWYMPGRIDDAPTVLIAHGIGANKQNFLYPAQLVHELGYGALLFDFRAHGDSEGRTSTLGVREAADVRAAHAWIVRRHPGRPVYALGYSMGGAAVALAAAEGDLFAKIVLDSTYSRVQSVARRTVFRRLGPLATPMWQTCRFWGWVWSGVDFDRRGPVDCMECLARRPLLLIHGTADVVIPYEETLTLYEATGRRAGLWVPSGVGHVEAMNLLEYRERLERFFRGRD